MNSRIVGNLSPNQTDYYNSDNKWLWNTSFVDLDTASETIPVPKRFIKSMNADTVIIRLATDSLAKAQRRDTIRYNGKLYSCLYAIAVKKDLGAIWLSYNYEAGKLKEGLKEVYRTWGMAKFRPDSDMKRGDKDSTTIFFGKFRHLNTPAVLRKDSLMIAKVLQIDPYRFEDKILSANFQLYQKGYDQCIKIADAAIKTYLDLKAQPGNLIKNEVNTNRQIGSFYFMKGSALQGLKDDEHAKIAFVAAKNLGYPIPPEIESFIGQKE
ncbi:hypothetical protein EZJ43_12905 [Pedobacter changchengzhani]|uniref:Uncharacterized protein n=1 Tax=Pedobacter changchengzhani TaxID=2529274 RepID=A0A4R5MIR1_9SPHI|nr:hypothetical protein [Pedobacter changchengzhani]TDG35517.1 hypothetical protein EZJ43_12905 [Pedobacter changchengzhani]